MTPEHTSQHLSEQAPALPVEAPSEAQPEDGSQLGGTGSWDAGNALLTAVALGVLALSAAYAAKPLLLRLAGSYYDSHLVEPSLLRDLAGWYYLSHAHPPVFALSCAVAVPLLYLVLSWAIARRER
ncbi:MAG: hypothetical protein M3328_07385 [Chloroflexota bacterium]|nr:hypothetical protein [Chloroflexota bacterium]